VREEDLRGHGGETGKVKPWPQTGPTGDAVWKPYAPEGVKGNKSVLNNMRCEISRHFKNKKMEYLRDKIYVTTDSKKTGDQCRGTN
jgi:hypothetical protein